MQITGKVFLVTGGGNGIGRETVLQLLKQGATVAAVDINKDALAETARLAAAENKLSTHTADLSDRAAVVKLKAEVLKAHQHIDGLLNIAGIIQPFIKVNELEYKDIERVLNVNLWGVIHTSKEFLPELLARPEAALVNVSSMGALAPVPGQSIYGASKAAVKLFTEGLTAELIDTKVAVTVVFPGAIATNISGNSGVSIGGGTQAEQEAASSFKMTSPQDAAQAIVRAVLKGSQRITIGGDARSLDRISRLMPKKVVGIIANKMKSLLG